MKITSKAIGYFTIWVRDDDENPTEFIYRSVKPEDGPFTCFNPQAERELRSRWTIVSTSALALKNCADLDSPACLGTVYVLQATQ